MSNRPIFTLIDGSKYKLQIPTNFFECDQLSILKKIDNLVNKYVKKSYILTYDGDLFEQNIKIAENINNMSDVSQNGFFCDTFDGVLMAYNNSSSEAIQIYTIGEFYIYLLTENACYRISCNKWLIYINVNNIYDFDKISEYQYHINKIKPNSVIKISKMMSEGDPYIYLNNNSMTVSNLSWNIIDTNYNIDDIVDIYTYHHDYCSLIFIINKNSSIDFIKTQASNHDEFCESFEIQKNIKFNAQLIKYNNQNIFNIKNVYDIIAKSKYFIGDFKKQIFVLFCVLNRYSKIPKVLKLLIVTKLIT